MRSVGGTNGVSNAATLLLEFVTGLRLPLKYKYINTDMINIIVKEGYKKGIKVYSSVSV